MKCQNCNAEIAEGLQFCTQCGTPVAPAPAPVQQYTQPVQQAAPAQPKKKAPKAHKAGKGNLKDKAAAVIANLPVDNKLKLPIAIGAGVLGCFLVLLLVAGIFRLIFGGGGVFTGIVDAANKTINKGNFTVELNMGGDTGEILVDMNVKKGELTAYGDADGDIIAVYEGQFISGDDRWGYSAQDIEDELEMFFEKYNENKDLRDVDLEELLDEAGVLEDVEDVINVKQLQKCYNKFLDKLDDEGWLEEYMGYEIKDKKGVTYHNFDVNVYEFAMAAIEIFEPAFEDSNDYEDLVDSLKSMKSMLRGMNFEASFGVEGGYLVAVEIKDMVEAEITDIGETEIDIDEIEDILDEAENPGGSTGEAYYPFN